jgi:lipopolysaccharide/colanic/teichoic acid biosynthesis glycosyltransferase
MVIFNKKEPFILFVGDLCIFALSLWISLAIRSFGIPAWDAYTDLLTPFIIVFLVWALIFFIAGLYDKYTTLLKDKMPGMIFNAQLANSLIAFAFFYLIPYFGVAPKTILFIDLFVSFVLIYAWRIYSHSLFGLKHKEPSLIIGSGEEIEDLLKEVNQNSQSELRFVSHIDLGAIRDAQIIDKILEKVRAEHVSVIVADLKDARIEPMLPQLYNLIFTGVTFIDTDAIYEDVFNRIPISLLKYDWFFENISTDKKIIYDSLKRLFDILLGLIAGIISFIFYPFVIVLLLCDEGHGFFSVQKRVGKNNQLISMYKFRTMKIANDGGKWNSGEKNYVTKIGAFLRKTRLDELPQLWNVVFGDVSLIGPRPEFPDAVKTYEKEIPYYGVRHLIKPGLSGWAILHIAKDAHHGIGIAETREKLSYDLYYVKNRSFMLDVEIALKTIKKLLSIAGI